MEPRPLRDFTVGLFVLAGLAALAYLSLGIGGISLKPSGGLHLYALFTETAGLKPRAAVEIGGMKVGEVTGMSLDKDFRVRVDIDVDPKLQLPEDSFASVFTEGVLGDRYLALQPGGSDDMLKNGDQITHTESALVLERLIGKLIYSLSGSGSATPGTAPGMAPGTAPGSRPAK